MINHHNSLRPDKRKNARIEHNNTIEKTSSHTSHSLQNVGSQDCVVMANIDIFNIDMYPCVFFEHIDDINYIYRYWSCFGSLLFRSGAVLELFQSVPKLLIGFGAVLSHSGAVFVRLGLLVFWKLKPLIF